MGEAETTEPMAFEDVVRVLGAMGAAELVLVGGQAVGLWAYNYRAAGRLPELTSEREMFVSKDVDAMAAPDDVRDRMHALARELGGVAQLAPVPQLGQELALPAINEAVVVFTDSAGESRRVDVLASLYGVDAQTVLETAAELIGPDGNLVYCLHPILLVGSRLANCVELPTKYRTRPAIRQAEVSIFVLREFIADIAARGEKGPREARKLVAQIEPMCTSERGLRAWGELGLESVDSRCPQPRASGRAVRGRGLPSAHRADPHRA